MTKLDIRRIITKYLNQEATTEEVSILYEWVKKEGNQEVFKKIIQADFLINYQSKSLDSRPAFTQFLKSIRDKKTGRLMSFYANKHVWGYAAALLVLITSSIYLITNTNSTATLQPTFDSNQITLQLDTGEIINLEHDNDTILKSKNGIANIYLNHGTIRHDWKKTSGVKSDNNVLRVPNGKILSVILEDGSVIKLNSGSELRYPSSFEGKSKREVFLKGEAFFEIAKNTSKPFVVKTDEMYTQVFGTVFNISNYDEDTISEVVLVEGSIGVGAEKDSNGELLTMLKPSQKLTNSKILNQSFFIEDVDVTPYIAWTKGIVYFENEKMSEIIKKLERQFNVHIVNESDILGELRFTGMFDKEDIDLVLKTIQTHTYFNYTKNGKTIIIKK
ncbi:FecR family protein [Maribacter antarcticus]|uniref:FecR family protein n=1 Tax=Maribacter antarcticus TaxID=505250 RepID=UPI00047CFD7A|nr:FecR domain-containing protein [Maribacter antarcticus]